MLKVPAPQFPSPTATTCRGILERANRHCRLAPSIIPGLTSSRTVVNGPIYRPPIDYNDDTFWDIMDNRKPRKKKEKRRPLGGEPFMKGVVLKTLIRNPKKPNSGNRKCVLVRLRNGIETLAKIPGEGHNLQEHHVVLVRCGRTQDTPGLKLKVVRGKYDCAHVVKKKI